MRFVFIFKMDLLRMSRERYPPDFTLGPLSDVFAMFLQNSETKKTANTLVF